MTRLWPEGDPIEVRGAAGETPMTLIWQGQAHRVTDLVRRWRVQTEWWRTPIGRDYFKLTTESGLLLVIYHDLQEDRWYLQRLYD